MFSRYSFLSQIRQTSIALFLMLFTSAALCLAQGGPPQGTPRGEAVPPPSIADKTKAMKKLTGYFNLYWEASTGKLWLEIDKWDSDFLYMDSLPAGIGSNDIGLDRGQLGESRVMRFQRIGPKVLFVQQNLNFRASSSSVAEKQSVQDAFAQSVLWGFDVGAEDKENGNVLVDATLFWLNDAHRVIQTLRRTRQGTYRQDAARSAIYLPMTKNFPQNTEVEATLTFAGDEPGNWVREVTPNPAYITVREHHSFIQLPDSGYHVRAFDPRSGFIDHAYADYSAPIGEDLEQRFIIRHRLQKKDPSAAISEPIKPIIYYVDAGTPEPVRTALMDGARWWNQAFESAGYRNAFRVEVLPIDADPMDVRFNVIQWVHRSTRGWSYGNAITDPRTGEIIKGQVSLGSLRMRQDYMIFEGLLSAYKKGAPVEPRLLATVLQRLRQLAAHEVGHTLGLQHNYISSMQGRASVMDYPHPLIKLATDGTLDFSQAYADGIGDWDKVTIQFGYSDFATGTDEHAALNSILTNAMKRGLTFLTDQDARPTGSAHPQVHLWDNGTNAIDELESVLKVRAVALKNFGENTLREGAPYAKLEDMLVPVYFYHRYQTEAASKIVGGQTYSYAIRGDGQVPITAVDQAAQRRALDAVLKTIAPETLTVPANIVKLIPPHPSGIPRTRESFQGYTGLTFDPMAAAEAAAKHAVSLLLDPQRAARLVNNHNGDPNQPGFDEVLSHILMVTWRSPRKTGDQAGVQRTVEDVVLYQIMVLAADEHASTEVRALAAFKLKELKTWAAQQVALSPDIEQRAHLSFAALQISKFETNPNLVIKPTEPKDAPPGQPIGEDDFDD